MPQQDSQQAHPPIRRREMAPTASSRRRDQARGRSADPPLKIEATLIAYLAAKAGQVIGADCQNSPVRQAPGQNDCGGIASDRSGVRQPVGAESEIQNPKSKGPKLSPP